MHIALAGPATPRTLSDLLDVPVDEALPAGTGGTPVNALARALVTAGHTVTLLTLSPDVEHAWEASAPGLRMVCRPIRRRARDRAKDFFRQERRLLLEGIEASGADVVHAHWTYEYGCAAVESRLPAVVTIHDAPVTILRYHPDVYRLVRLGLAGRVRLARPALTAVSPYAASRWSREMRDRGSVVVIPNVAPTFTVQRTPAPYGRRRVVMMGSSAGLKNIDAGISAFLLAAKARGDLELVVIGPGLDAGSPFAQKYGGEMPNVDFLGELTAPQVHRQLAMADLFVHPSLEETQGMVLLEAMRARVPVVGGAASGGVPWTLDEGRAGRLVDVRSPRRMSEAILAVLGDECVAACYVERALELLERRFSPAVVGAAYVAMYEDVANHRG